MGIMPMIMDSADIKTGLMRVAPSLLAARTGSKPLFFFFQAEDGIRDIGVTGVQTCALPICRGRRARPALRSRRRDRRRAGARDGGRRPGLDRSEERRVGKECRSRWSPY